MHTLTTHNKIKRKTPYDFMAITDHAEYFGVMPRLIDTSDPLAKTDLAKKLQKNDPSGVEEILHSIMTSTAMPEFVEPALMQSNWQNYVKVTNKYNDPGKFTTLIAFEWTSIPNGRNMHRNVFFRNDTGPVAPYSRFRLLSTLRISGPTRNYSAPMATKTLRCRTTAMFPMAGCTLPINFWGAPWMPAMPSDSRRTNR